MMRSFIAAVWVGVSLLVGSTLLAQASPKGAATEQSFREKYSVIADRNIFSRARTSPSRRREPPPGPIERPPEPEDLVVLTGTVQQGPSRFAFVEERGRTIKVREGDEIARGKVGKIGFNVLEFEKDGKRVTVDVGKAFSGKTPPSRSRSDPEPRRSSPPAVSSSSPGAPGESPAVAADATAPAQEPPKAETKSEGGGGANDILERMRRRRLEEEQKK